MYERGLMEGEEVREVMGNKSWESRGKEIRMSIAGEVMDRKESRGSEKRRRSTGWEKRKERKQERERETEEQKEGRKDKRETERKKRRWKKWTEEKNKKKRIGRNGAL
ncbi:protein PXR1-like [Belonocnema kinseyi]|uniref:protein PXR1-like n=1 Tax=Belonocnema kinseyi TaxID=2817044 RepID=UPI00143CE1E1|nr:protein PXR1-like [Belonocnema kinseyi]